MSNFEPSMGFQSAAFRIAESAERYSQLYQIGEVASSVFAEVPNPATSTYIIAIAELQNSMRTALEPGITATAQLKLHESKLLAALAPVNEATQRLSALAEAIKINTSFHDLGKVGAFAQIRHFEELTGDRILKFDEDHFVNKLLLSNSFEPIGTGLKIDADLLPFHALPYNGSIRYFEEPNHAYRTFEDQPSFPDHTTTCPTKHLIDPNFRPRPDYLAILADRTQSIEKRSRAFALSGLPLNYWSDYFHDEDFYEDGFYDWVEDEVETAKRHRERILCLVNKINQIYRRASRIILQAYRRLNRSWKNSFVFSWRHAYLNQIHTLKDAEIKLSDFFILKTPRYSRESSFFSYEFCRKHDFPPPGNSL